MHLRLSVRGVDTGAGEENGLDHSEHWLRFPYDSTFLRSHDVWISTMPQWDCRVWLLHQAKQEAKQREAEEAAKAEQAADRAGAEAAGAPS
jgi:hypothetical protein